MALTTAATTEQDALLGARTKLGFRDLGSSGAFTLIGAISGVGAPKQSVGKVESIRLNSTRKNYRPTLPDQTASFSVQHIPRDTGVAALRTMLATNPVPVKTWQIVYEDGVTDTFPAFAESYEPGDVENEGLMTASVALQIVGDIVTADAVAP